MADVPSGYVVLENSGRRARAGATLKGAAEPTERLTVSVRVRRRPDAPSLADAARGGQRLTREEFAATFGAADNDLDAVARFGRDHGLVEIERSVPRRTIVLAGTVESAGEAFAVDLGTYESDEETYRGREGDVYVPAELKDVVEGVFGLDNRRMAKRAGAPVAEPEAAPAVPAAAPEVAPAAATSPLTPPEVARLYDFPTGVNGAGETIGLMEFEGGYEIQSIQDFFNGLGLPTPSLTSVGIDGAHNAPGAEADAEVALDIDVAGSVAPGARIAVYFAPWTEQGWVDAVTTAVHDAANKPSVLSISWGWPENETFGGVSWTPAAIAAVDATFQEAAVLGVTVFAASGDYGSNCGIGDRKAHVLYPCSDPYVTACGGTSIANVSGSSFTQTTWPSTGGGVSEIFPVPTWQGFANVPANANGGGRRGRGVPDVAGNADPASGYTITVDGQAGVVGGTSAVAPLYAGLVALMNEALGEPVGYLNPALYSLEEGYVFRDVADAVSNASYGAPGYTSGPGWDACTGFGSINGTALMQSLRGVGLPPALAVFSGGLYAAWKGMERDDRIFFSVFNGTSWSAQQQVPGVGTSAGPSLALYGGKLYMAWKGVLGDDRLWFTSFDGSTWAPQQQISGVGSSVGPRLVVQGGLLYAIWKGMLDDEALWYSTFNGTSWAPQRDIPGTGTSVGPALAEFEGAVIAAWKGIEGDEGIWYSTFNGTNWAAQKEIPGVGTTEGPSLAVFGNELYAAWKGIDADQGIYFSSFNGSTWASQKNVAGVGTSQGPGLAVFDNKLYMMWKGIAGDQRLWFSSFNGSTWAPQQVGPGETSPDL